jgi:hypothetical protein
LEAGKGYIRKFGEDPEIYLWMANSAAWLQRGSERELYLKRSLELFGDESSNLYSLNWALAPRLDQDTSSARQLLDHWILILRSRLELAPDNYRLLCMLIVCEGYAGDRTSMRAKLDQYYGDLRARPGEVSSGGFGWVIPCLAYLADEGGLDQAIRLARQSDLANLHGFVHGQVWRDAVPRSATHILDDLPAFQSLEADIRRRLDELARHYMPAVALEHGRARS